MSRFKIIDPSGRRYTTRHSTIVDVVNTLRSKDCDTTFQQYWIECTIDDIEISADELLEAWEDGERPEDLQMF